MPDLLISWKTFFVTIPVSMVSTLVINPVSINSADDLINWIAIVLFGHLAMVPYVIYGQDKKNVREQLFLVVLMGTTRGGVLALLMPLVGVTDELPITFRILNSIVGVFYWFIVGAILLQFMVNFRKDMKNLVEETILSDNSLELPEHYVDSNILLSRISALQKDISLTLQGTPTREKLNKSAKDIDKLVKEHIRPLSHSEWREGELVWLKAGFLRVVVSTLRQRALPFLGIFALTIPYSILGQVYRFGLVRTVATQILWFSVMLIVRQQLTLHFPPRNGSYLVQNLGLILGAYLFAGPFVFLIHSSWPGNEIAAASIVQLQLAQTTSFAILCSVTAMCITLIGEEKSAFRIIGQQLKDKNLKSLLELGAKSKAEANYAQYLHAEVQSQLLACKLLLLKSAESNFTLLPPEVTKQILDRFERIQQPYERIPAKKPSLRVAELAESWRGLANIELNFPPQIDENGVPHDVVAQLIEEAIVNSIRHGKARNIEVKATLTEDSFTFEIIDDGAAKVLLKGSGLGTILFSTFAQDWSIGREDNRTVVRFSVLRH